MVALSTHVEAQFRVRFLKIAIDGNVTLAGSLDVEGEVTCLSLSTVGESRYVMAGLWKDDHAWLVLCPLQEGRPLVPLHIELTAGTFHYFSIKPLADKANPRPDFLFQSAAVRDRENGSGTS